MRNLLDPFPISPWHPKLPSSLYKFTKASTAVTVLRNQSLRWSNPATLNRFNDGFDVSTELAANCPITELSAEMSRRILSFVEGTAKLPDDANDHLKLLVNLAAIPGVRADMLKELRKPVLPGYPGTAGFQEQAQKLDEMWAETRKEMRILCLTEVPDVESMWVNYAESSSGAALEFSPAPASLFSLAEPIIYDDVSPLTRAGVWADFHVGGDARAMTKGMFQRAIYSKAECWKPEKEWRVVTYVPAEGTGVTDVPFDQRDLVAVYLGREMKPEDEVRIIALRDRRYPKANVFKTRRGKTKVVFDHIK